nr:peptidoglycan editing factor PgeF [Litchfieldia alkalitelluris]
MRTEPFIFGHNDISQSFLHQNSFNDLGFDIIAGFTTKIGGNSKGFYSSFNLGLHVDDLQDDVKSNRKLLGEYLGFSTDTWISCEQVHKSTVKKITKDLCGKGVFNYEDAIPATDGIYTNEPNILLTLCFADCVPLYFYEPNLQLIGIAHAGWKGTVSNIAGEMVKIWVKDEGVNPKNVFASIGPSIDHCCYIVDDYVIDFVNKMNLENKLIYSQIGEGQYRLSLKSLNEQLLLASGIPREQISASSHCTSCEKEIFFSHRRDKGKTGRMLSFIGRKEAQNSECSN